MQEKLSYSAIEDILKMAVECAEYYQREHLDNKEFTLYLANGEKVTYMITPSSVPHLLGIDIYALKSVINLEGEDLVSMMKDLQAKTYELCNKFRIGYLKQEDIFSKYIYQKLENFKYNVKNDIPSSLEETLFVCHYKSENSWDITTKNQKYDYIIVKKLSNGKNGLLCLKKLGDHCVVMSNQVPDDDIKFNEILKELITNQEVTILSGMELYSRYNETKYNRNILPKDKVKKSRNLRKFKSKYNCKINILSDYEYILGRLGNNNEERYENRSTIDVIVNAIANGKILNAAEYEDSMLASLINAWNDHICQTGAVTYNENELTYTKAIEELTKFKKLATSLEAENRKLQEDITELSKRNSDLTSQNDEKQEMIHKVYEIIKPGIK